MIDKFGNAFYLIIYLAHFIIIGSYAYQLVFDTKKFLKGRGVDKTATLIVLRWYPGTVLSWSPQRITKPLPLQP